MLIKDIVDAVLSIEFATRSTPDSEKASLYRIVNSNLISLLLNQAAPTTLPVSAKEQEDTVDICAVLKIVNDNFVSILHDYLWKARCCSNPTDIADTFNSMHVAGILALKSLYVLLEHDTTDDINSIDIRMIFPHDPTIHVSQKCIMHLNYSELVYVVVNLQQYWHVLLGKDVRKAILLLLLCMARFGYLCSHKLSEVLLDDIQQRNDVGLQKKKFVVSKLCQRNFLTTFMCMARDANICYNSKIIVCNSLDATEKQAYVTQQISMTISKLPAHIDASIASCFAKIQQPRVSACAQEVSSKVDDAGVVTGTKMWDFLSQKLGDGSMGEPPRKMTEALEILLCDVIITTSNELNSPNNNTITASCVNVIKTALEYFYIVPSGDRFREINLKQEVCAGQRLNYAFEYMHFDTGQVSQVVYLHNLNFKAKPPPTVIGDWDDHAVAGPISAFLQLVPDLQIWLSDSDDPLGILGDVAQITRPAVTKSSDDASTISAPVQEYNKRWAIIVNKSDAFLVDRQNRITYRSPSAITCSGHHRVFSLLVLYLRKNNLVHGICTLAINGLKIND
jgi:hypothetical protein